MSDRAYAQIIVYGCPEDQRDDARAAIFDAFEAEPDTLNEAPSVDTMPGSDDVMAPGRFAPAAALVLGARYGGEQCPLDHNETIAAALIESAPGATFVAWVDPAYEYPGALTAYAPELGRFDASCDADGNPTITSGEVRRLMAASATDGPYGDRWPDANLREALNAALGIAWYEAIDTLRAALDAATEPAVPAEA